MLHILLKHAQNTLFNKCTSVLCHFELYNCRRFRANKTKFKNAECFDCFFLGHFYLRNQNIAAKKVDNTTYLKHSFGIINYCILKTKAFKKRQWLLSTSKFCLLIFQVSLASGTFLFNNEYLEEINVYSYGRQDIQLVW